MTIAKYVHFASEAMKIYIYIKRSEENI